MNRTATNHRLQKTAKSGYPVPDEDFLKIRIQRYCAYQERCSHEVEIKLQEWKAPSGKIGQIMNELKDDDFLNDTRYAQSFVRGKFSINHWGRKKISYELIKKGISQGLIIMAMEEIDEPKYLEVLQNMIRNKSIEIKAGKNLTIREKLINFALGKGFEFDLILRTINHLKI